MLFGAARGPLTVVLRLDRRCPPCLVLLVAMLCGGVQLPCLNGRPGTVTLRALGVDAAGVVWSGGCGVAGWHVAVPGSVGAPAS